MKFTKQRTTTQILSTFKQVVDALQTRIDQIYTKEYDLNVERTTIEEELRTLSAEKGEAHKAIQQISKIYS